MIRWKHWLGGMIAALLLPGFSAPAPDAAEQISRWTPELMIQLPRVGNTAVSPDGKTVAYTVSEPLMDGEKSEYLSQVWTVPAGGGESSRRTRGEKSSTAPSFSPDGKYLAFLSAREGEKTQVWVMPAGGGEPVRATEAAAGVNAYAWSPDGTRIAYTANDPETPAEGERRKEKRDMEVRDAVSRSAHLYAAVLDGGKVRKTRRLTGGPFHVTGFDWLPDGKSLAFCHQENPSPDVWMSSDLAVAPADSGAVRPLVTGGGADLSPRCSPDGGWVAYLSDGGDQKWGVYYYHTLMAVSAKGGEPRALTPGPMCSPVRIIGWSPDSREVYVQAVSRTVNRIYAVPLSGGKPRMVTPGPGTDIDAALAGNGTALAYVHQTTDTPPEVHVLDLPGGAPRKLTGVNDRFPRLPMGRTEVITWKSKDGLEIEGLLTYPVGYEKGKRCPLALYVHGGPMGVFTETFTGAGGSYPIQAFAQEGYALLRPNPRGSSGYGRDFALANYRDWGYGDYEDLMSGVDRVIAMGVAHPESLCVMGWSYGGYMTNMVITRTNRFKAAAVGAGVTNLMSFTGTSDIHSFIPDYMGGEYWDRPEAYRKHSPMFNIKGVSTPTLILHGEEDVRVPLSQGLELHNALKRQNCPVEMVIYPRMGHGISEPKFLLDIGRRHLDWCNSQLRGTPETSSRVGK